MNAILKQTLPEWVDILDEYLYTRNHFRNGWTTGKSNFYKKGEEKKKHVIELTNLCDRIYAEIEEIREKEKSLTPQV